MTKRKTHLLPRGRPKKLTERQIAAAIRRAGAGELLTHIAVEYGVHRNTLYRAVRKGIKT